MFTFFQQSKQIALEALDISTIIPPNSHLKSILATLKSNGLPFRDIVFYPYTWRSDQDESLKSYHTEKGK